MLTKLAPARPKIVISPTRMADMTVGCSWQVHLKMLGIKSLRPRRSLQLGRLIDAGIESVLHGDDLSLTLSVVELTNIKADVQGLPGIDVQFAQEAVRLFHNWWLAQGELAPVTLPNGHPAVQVRVVSPLPGETDVELKAFVDLLAIYLPTGELTAVDFKTCKSPHKEAFGVRSDQMTFAQILTDDNLGPLGLSDFGRVAMVGYLEIHTGAKTPRLGELKLYPRRTAAQSEELLRKSAVVAGRIRRQEFFRESGMAFNSPCNLCDFEPLCRLGARACDGYQIPEGVVIPKGIHE